MSKLPTLNSDQEAEDFLDQEDLSNYLQKDNFVLARIDFNEPRFEELPKTENVHMRFPKPLLDAVKEKAKEQGIHYQKYVRRVLELSLKQSQSPR